MNAKQICLILFVISWIFLLARNNKLKTDANANMHSESISHIQSANIYVDSTMFHFQKFHIIIVTKFVKNMVDSILFNCPCSSGKDYYPVIDQTLFFYENNSLTNSFSIPLNKLLFIYGDKSDSMLENHISEISIVKIVDGYCYGFYGGGVCGQQSEYFGLYSLRGAPLAYSYNTWQGVDNNAPCFPSLSYGNLEEIYDSLKINDSIINQPISKFEMKLLRKEIILKN